MSSWTSRSSLYSPITGVREQALTYICLGHLLDEMAVFIPETKYEYDSPPSDISDGTQVLASHQKTRCQTNCGRRSVGVYFEFVFATTRITAKQRFGQDGLHWVSIEYSAESANK